MSKNFPTGCESATALKYKRDHGIPSHIELRTSKQWKHIGYQVKKGSVCKYRFKAPSNSRKRFLSNRPAPEVTKAERKITPT